MPHYKLLLETPWFHLVYTLSDFCISVRLFYMLLILQNEEFGRKIAITECEEDSEGIEDGSPMYVGQESREVGLEEDEGEVEGSDGANNTLPGNYIITTL